jgi:hypothetical protein
MYNLEEIAKQYRGGTVVIVGNGPSLVKMPGKDAAFQRYIHFTTQRENGEVTDINEFAQAKALVHRIENSPHPMWTINGAWSYHPKSTLGFLMDDQRFHRAETHPQHEWYDNLIKTATIPIMTSKSYPDYPTMIEFPIREAIARFKTTYFGETVDYMIALAGLFEVKRIEFVGCDYQLQDRFPGERASTEYWIGKMESLGIECDASKCANLMKQSAWESHFHPLFYGFSKDDFPVSDNELEELINGEERENQQRKMA